MKLVLAALAVLALAACGGESSSPASTAEAAADGITDIDGIEPIREQFLRDAGSPRLLIVFSPT